MLGIVAADADYLADRQIDRGAIGHLVLIGHLIILIVMEIKAHLPATSERVSPGQPVVLTAPAARAPGFGWTPC
jgi:hypothetical protein